MGTRGTPRKDQGTSPNFLPCWGQVRFLTAEDLGRNGLGTRGAYYCVPLPGETPWAKAAAAAGRTAAASAGQSQARTKRSRDEDKFAGFRGRGQHGATHPRPIPLVLHESHTFWIEG